MRAQRPGADRGADSDYLPHAPRPSPRSAAFPTLRGAWQTRFPHSSAWSQAQNDHFCRFGQGPRGICRRNAPQGHTGHRHGRGTGTGGAPARAGHRHGPHRHGPHRHGPHRHGPRGHRAARATGAPAASGTTRARTGGAPAASGAGTDRRLKLRAAAPARPWLLEQQPVEALRGDRQPDDPHHGQIDHVDEQDRRDRPDREGADEIDPLIERRDPDE